jgi:hypothetical protein
MLIIPGYSSPKLLIVSVNLAARFDQLLVLKQLLAEHFFIIRSTITPLDVNIFFFNHKVALFNNI